MSYIIGILLKILHDERLLLIYFPYRYLYKIFLCLPLKTIKFIQTQNAYPVKDRTWTESTSQETKLYFEFKDTVNKIWRYEARYTNSFKVDNNACLRKNLKTTWCLLPLTLVNTTSCTCCNYNKILIIIHPDNVN